MKNISLKITIITSIIVFILSFGTTYAISVWSSGNTLISGTTKCFMIDYEKGQDINFTDGLVAQTSFDKDNSVSTTLSIARNEDCDLCGTGSIKVNITSSIDLSSGALSYKIFDSKEKNITTGPITSTGTTEIYKDFDITSRSPLKFIIYFYLDSNKLTNDYLEASFNGKIYVEAKSNGNICDNNKEDNYCIDNNITNLSECILRSENNSNSLESAKTYIANKGTPKFNNIAPQSIEGGLYKAVDYDGNPTYYFRGDAQNNYVYYAGYYFRIIRVNSDGSIRIIYDGAKPHKNGEVSDNRHIGSSPYNSNYCDPNYSGYMYSENFELKENSTSMTSYTNFSSSSTYYYGSSYTFDTNTKKFKLSGNTTSGVWPDVYSDVIANYPYTCFGTSATEECNYILKLIRYVNTSQAVVSYISYSSKDYASTLTNTTNSTIKTYVDDWYKNNILNKKDSNNVSYSEYLTDNIFCNDRSLYRGDGYNLAVWSPYSPYNRTALLFTPSLTCSQTSDKFTTSSTLGNGKLTYPVGLITADEVSLAGGKYRTNNDKYYLYTGKFWWTMSPYHFNNSNGKYHNFAVTSTGELNAGYGYANSKVRPVLNLKSDILISSGSGTYYRPYILKLN